MHTKCYERTDARTHGRMDARTDGRIDRGKTICPPTNSRGGIKQSYIYLCFYFILKHQDYSPGTTVSPTGEADRYDIKDMLLKVVLISITK